MSIGSILNMARSGMNAQQTAVQVASQNISNATTEGYSKQRVELATALPTVFPYGSVGTGVDIKTISRARDAMLDTTYRTDSSSQSRAETTSAALREIQSVFGEPSDSGLAASLDAFWSAWNDLASDPTNSAAKSVVRSAGDNVASTLNRFARQLDQVDQNNRESMNADVGRLNALSQQVAGFNKQIVTAESNGNTAPDLRDARDRLLDEMSQLTGGQIVERSSGAVAVYVGGRMLVDGATANPIQMNDGQPPTISFAGSAVPLDGIGGSLGAKIDVSANRVPAVLAQLDAIASSLVQNVNAAHNGGKTYSGNPPVGGVAGNFFEVTTPAPAGTDPYLTARGIRLASTLASAADVSASGAAATGPGNNATASTIAALRDSTIGNDFQSLIGSLATSARQADDDAAVQKTLAANASARRESVSGVSTDEELISVIQHQHAYQAAARLVSVVDDMTQTLIDLGR
jgi:flagellar hook-associated protein 1 FlgK